MEVDEEEMKGGSRYHCQQCGYESSGWLGRCPGCGGWNTFVEEPVGPPSKFRPLDGDHLNPQILKEVEVSKTPRLLSGIKELDRVLGGGLVPGSLVLIGGDPGIGKSTLILHATDSLSKRYGVVLYVSGEESIQQLRLRADRIGVSSSKLYVLAETNIDHIYDHVERIRPVVLVVDSIQTIYIPELTSSPGSIAQVRECTTRLLYLAKQKGLPIFIIGHVTKEGTIAGPRTLEHIVDVVLYFEGDQHHLYRVMRARKNRFGPTNEVGVFEMRSNGLVEVTNPSSSFLRERPKEESGSVVTPSMEGTRPILVELQALVTPSSYGMARRETSGVDYNRVSLLLAVLEKRAGFRLGSQDVFVNVAGGIRILEPAVDLGIVFTIISSLLDRPIPHDLVCFGEVGLTGEIRSVGWMEERLGETAKLGFKRSIIPQHNLKADVDGLEVIGVSNIREALDAAGLI